MASPSRKSINQAVEAFIDAQSWKERKRIVETRRNMLLTDTAEQILNNMLEQNLGNEETTQRLQEYRDLLRQSRNEGVEVAFANRIHLELLLDQISRLTDSDAIPVKVEAYRKALEQIIRNRDELLWAALHVGLAVSLIQNPLGDRTQNLEHAITHFYQALEVYTPRNNPQQWAEVQFYLGLVYSDRIEGDRTQNLERAITHFQQTLEVYTPRNNPQQWAEVQFYLGLVYSDRQALRVYTPRNNPQRWFRRDAQFHLGSVYSSRVLGERTDNLERAISHFHQALTIFNPQAFPEAWAKTQNALGNVYSERLAGNQTNNLAQAISHYQEALRFLTPETNPLDYASTQNNLGKLYQDQGRYGEAEQLYQQNLAIVERLGDLGAQASNLHQLGIIAQQQGNYTEARQLYQQSAETFKRQGNVREAGFVLHQLETLDLYVNVSIVSQDDRMTVPKTTSLGTNKTYALRLNIGPILNESVVQNAEQYPFPVHLLPPTDIGYWLEVIVVSDDFVIPLRQYPLFLPQLGPSWVCDCPPGKDHQCSENERQAYLFIPIQAPEQPQVARLRIAIYYQKNLVQSQLLTAKISEMERLGAGHSSIIDYTLASDLCNLSFLPPRTLHILTNDNADGSHRIVINGEEDDVLAFNLTEGQIRVTVDATREALRNVHFEEYGGTLGSRRQRRNLLDGNNAKKKEAFIKDLTQLAPLGWKLWTLLLSDRRDWGKKLLAPAMIQVSRTLSSTLAFPWALVYDIPLASQGPYKVCPLLENWDENKKLIDLSVSRCPHESTHGLKNTLCPFGFWGFRHVIEQPASMSSGRNLPMMIHRTNHPPALVAGFSQALEKDQTAKHLQTMKQQLTLFTVQDHTSLQDIITALAAPVEVVYFYCHGGREPLAGTSQHTPYLQVGEDERFQPSDITTWRVADWPDHHWEQTSPLVFINGCHTAELTPELLVNFVDAFSTAYAAGVIGTEISVEQDIAAEAAEHFFNAFQQNKTVGQALQQMRLHFLAKGNLLGLAYTPYCSANLHL